MRGEVESEDFGLLAEWQQDVVLLQLHELLNISCPSLAFTDHFVLVDVQKVYLSVIGPNDQSVPLVLIAEGSYIRLRAYLFDGQTPRIVEISINVSLKYRYLAIVGSAEY